MLHHPLTNQAARSAEHQQAMQVRNALQVHIRNLLSRINSKILAGIDRDERQRLIGELQGYMAIRKSLAPTIAPDRFADLIHRAIVDLDCRREFAEQSHVLCQDMFTALNNGASDDGQLTVLRRLVTGLSAHLPLATTSKLFTSELREALTDGILLG